MRTEPLTIRLLALALVALTAGCGSSQRSSDTVEDGPPDNDLLVTRQMEPLLPTRVVIEATRVSDDARILVAEKTWEYEFHFCFISHRKSLSLSLSLSFCFCFSAMAAENEKAAE